MSVIRHEIGEAFMVGKYLKTKCLYCNKDFYLNNHYHKKNIEIACSFCGEKHINTSNKKIILKKLK